MLKRAGWTLLLPLGLAVGSIILLIRVSSSSLFGIDLLLLLLVLSLSTLVSLSIILRELVLRFREQSMSYVRKQAIEEHRRFLKRLDHELKNPLTAIRAGLASLSLVTDDEKALQTVRVLESESLRLTRLITNLRKMAEIETLPLEFYPVEVAQLVSEISTIHHLQFATTDRIFTLDVADDDLVKNYTINGDQDLLLLALHNVLENAYKYTDTGDSITLRFMLDEDDLLIKIEDTGMGIPTKELEYVWDELYRGERVSHIPGSGIGLALVKNIIEQHDGEVLIQSVLHQGTTVTLLLPLSRTL